MTIDFTTFPHRMVHLDFHTGPDVPNLGHDFDPEQFATTFSDAHVDSVTVFAKDHHGHLFYDTDRPERHPGLPRDLDLLGAQIEALHSVGIKAPIYISIQCDEWAANQHPDWIALDEELRQVKMFPEGLGAYDAGWQILDMSSPYQDFVAEQITEVLEKYSPVDGIFLDMCWDQPSSSRWAKLGMAARGMDARVPAQRDQYARAISLEYMRRFTDLIDPALHPGSAVGTWFNSRPKTRLHEESEFVRHVEIESLPSGGWGYAYLPYVARFVRPLGLPTLSHTGRFHKSWGDNGGLKTHAALLYECSQILSQGITSGVGDLLSPSGRPDPTVYELIGSVYAHIEACEPFLEGGVLLSEVAVIVDPELGDTPGVAAVGAVRVLQQLRQQFDIVGPRSDLSGYRLVVIPEGTVVDDALAASITAHVARGGSLLVSAPAASAAALPQLGVDILGPSPFSHIFMHDTDPDGTDPDVTDPDVTGRRSYDSVMYERTIRMTPLPGTDTLVAVVEPYFERSFDRFSGHEYTVAAPGVSDYALLATRDRVVTVAAPIFTALAVHGNSAYRDLVGRAISRVLPDPLILDDGPAHLEATVVEAGHRTVVHLLSFIPSRLADGLDIINDPIPVSGLTLKIRRPDAPVSVTLQPEGRSLEFTHAEGYVETTLSFDSGHTMVVVE